MGKAIKRKRQKVEEESAVYDVTLKLHKDGRKKKLPDFLVDGRRDFHLDKYCCYEIRSVNDFKCNVRNRNRRLHLLVRHLYAQYPVPSFMNEVFVRKTEYDYWFFAIAQGKSLYKLYAKPYMSKKATHIFLTKGRKEYSILQNIWFAKILCLTEDIRFADTWARSGMCNAGRDYRLTDDFWKAVMQFFVNNPIYKVNELNEILDFLMSQKEENPTFSLKGRTLDSVKKMSDKWHEDISRIKKTSYSSWEGIPVENWKLEGGEKGDKSYYCYEIVQIKNSKDLMVEGRAMRHCVSSYAKSCAEGYCAIFSMRKVKYETGRKEYVKRRCVTIETNSSGEWIQVRGYANRSAKKGEWAIIHEWNNEIRRELKKT